MFLFCFWWLGTTITCSLQKRRNCVFIHNDSLQYNYIKQIINVIQVRPYELQEVGLKKWEFSETLVPKMSKESQPPVGGMFGNEHFGRLVNIEDPMEEDIDIPHEKIPISMKNLSYMILLISLMSWRKC